jgi:hypothetical protein
LAQRDARPYVLGIAALLAVLVGLLRLPFLESAGAFVVLLIGVTVAYFAVPIPRPPAPTRRRQKFRSRPSNSEGAIGANIGRGLSIHDNRFEGFERPINTGNSEDVDIYRNKFKR